MGANARSEQPVLYELRQEKPGVACVHTALVRGIAVMKKVRWYLTALLARTLLDVAVQNKSGNEPTRRKRAPRAGFTNAFPRRGSLLFSPHG